ncbi:hypothetical protein DFH11DRAFT_1551015 [Phellopilus nigrolimitatus]|nr:hypothetical protein DFH11DRAFT_1551015 [Phellopilus nigrolimitatus]
MQLPIPLSSVLTEIHGALKEVLDIADPLNKTLDGVKYERGITDGAAEQYIQNLARLREEVANTVDRLDILVQVGQKFSLSEQEQTEAHDAITQLSDEVLSTKNLLMDRNAIPLIVDDLVAQDTTLWTASGKLNKARTSIHDQFSHIFAIYEDHLRTHLKLVSHESTSLDPAQTDTVLNFLEFAIRKNPFHVFIDRAGLDEFAPTLALVNSQRSLHSGYSDTAERLGRSWVSEFMRGRKPGPEYVRQLSERYLVLLENVLPFLDAEIESLPEPETRRAEEDNTLAQTTGHEGPHQLSGTMVPARLRQMINWGRKQARGDGAAANVIDLKAAEAEETRQRVAMIGDIRKLVCKEIEREKTRRFSVAVCGMVKAGKSLFLDAFLGQTVLPSDELPSTAWPCRIRHVKGQEKPRLAICERNMVSNFQKGIEALRLKFDEAKEQTKSRLPACEPGMMSQVVEYIFDGAGKSKDKDTSPQEDMELILGKLAPFIKKSWDTFKERSFMLRTEAHGTKEVVELLSQVNAVVRLCKSFGIRIDVDHDWPLVTVEFESIRNETLDGEFEIFDLPGIGEYTESYFGFQELINLVGQDVSAIIPVVSLKEVPKNDWSTALPKILCETTGLREPSVIVCTHRDQIEKESDLHALTDRVLSEFSSKSNDLKVECVACSSRLGLGAQILLKMSQEGKPTYDNLFDENVPEPCRACAKHILGSSEKLARRSFRSLTDEEWRIELEETLVESGLREAVDRITQDVVGKAHSETLRRSLKSMTLQLHIASIFSSSVLLRMQRSREEAEESRKVFGEAQRQIAEAQKQWAKEESHLRQDAMKSIERELDSLKERSAAKAKEIYNEAKRAFTTNHPNDSYSESEGGVITFRVADFSRGFIKDILDAMKRQLKADLEAIVPEMRHKIVDREITMQHEVLAGLIGDKLGRDHNLTAAGIIARTSEISPMISELDMEVFSKQVSHDEMIEVGRASVERHIVISEDRLIAALRSEMIDPSVDRLRERVEPVFKVMMDTARDATLGAIKQMMSNEERNLALELSRKDKEPTPEETALAVVAHLNFTSAEAAIQGLDVCASVQTDPYV